MREVRSQGSLLEVIDIGGQHEGTDAAHYRTVNKTATLSLCRHSIIVFKHVTHRREFFLRRTRIRSMILEMVFNRSEIAKRLLTSIET